jgi:hypothetical protein
VDVSTWPDVVVMLISAATGGGLLKVFDTWLTRAKLKNETARQLRDEAREEANSLKNEVNYFREKMREKEKDIDDWRKRFWDLDMEYRMFKLTVSNLLIKAGYDPTTLLKDSNEA